MEDIRLLRELADDDGTFGRWLMPAELGGMWWYTVEDDWRQNQVGESCIPLGRYELVRTVYHRHGYETFEITGVPNRSRILVHPANTENDVMGCCGLGCVQGYQTVEVDEDTGFRKVRKRAVLQSKKAFNEFMRAMKGVDRWPLRVTGVVG